jgi:hypothetical protein
MEKISGILPASPRVTKVDLSEAPPSRAAIPGMDRGIGAMSHIADVGSSAPTWKSKEARQAALVTDVSNSFFMKAKPEAESDTAKESSGHLQQPEGLFPKGSFIDRSA